MLLRMLMLNYIALLDTPKPSSELRFLPTHDPRRLLARPIVNVAFVITGLFFFVARIPKLRAYL